MNTVKHPRGDAKPVGQALGMRRAMRSLMKKQIILGGCPFVAATCDRAQISWITALCILLGSASCNMSPTDGCIGGLVVQIQSSQRLRVRYATSTRDDLSALPPIIVDECRSASSYPPHHREGDTLTIHDTEFGGAAPSAYSLIIEIYDDCGVSPKMRIENRAVESPPAREIDSCSLAELVFDLR